MEIGIYRSRYRLSLSLSLLRERERERERRVPFFAITLSPVLFAREVFAFVLETDHLGEDVLWSAIQAAKSLALERGVGAGAPGGQAEYRSALCVSFLFKFYVETRGELGFFTHPF